jgi:hypothetical protein
MMPENLNSRLWKVCSVKDDAKSSVACIRVKRSFS